MDRKKVLPVLKAIQGHIESGRLWQEHIDSILFSDDLKFKSTTHDRCIYRTEWKGEVILLLRQVDDFAISCKNESTAKEIFDIIGTKLQLPLETDIPFDYFGPLKDFNGVDVNKFQEYIEIACPDYIDRVIRSHGWENDFNIGKQGDRPSSPLPEVCIHKMYESFLGTGTGGPAEGTKEHHKLETDMGFSYRTLLGELMYAYVSCRLDIAYAITTLSKFATRPTKLHYTF